MTYKEQLEQELRTLQVRLNTTEALTQTYENLDRDKIWCVSDLALIEVQEHTNNMLERLEGELTRIRVVLERTIDG